ncbi:MAG: hypothetical protein M3Y85_06190 [Bacteroidota bacterium]|nr:hypothetical protein [Bacteroidota bacterium]
MKITLLITCLVLFFVTTIKAQKVEINDKGFFINRHKISRETTMAGIDSLIGKPDRVSLLANIIWTYDNLGIFIYFSPQDSALKHIGFDMVKRDLKFSPLTPFKGSFIMHNNKITTAWSLARLKRIKALKFEENPVYLQPAYTGYLKIYFEFDEANAALKSSGVTLDFKKSNGY